jgi:hypothetical protein
MPSLLSLWLHSLLFKSDTRGSIRRICSRTSTQLCKNSMRQLRFSVVYMLTILESTLKFETARRGRCATIEGKSVVTREHLGSSMNPSTAARRNTSLALSNIMLDIFCAHCLACISPTAFAFCLASESSGFLQ